MSHDGQKRQMKSQAEAENMQQYQQLMSKGYLNNLKHFKEHSRALKSPDTSLIQVYCPKKPTLKENEHKTKAD